MFKYRYLALVVSYFIFTAIKADEGMWLLTDVKNKYKDMSSLGLELKPEEIFSNENSSLKDAVVIFGAGCTGEIISSNGLILTNHHCGFQAIQQLSTVENDYIKDGYWAKDQESELACKGLTVKFLRTYKDITDSIIPLVDTIKQLDIRERKIEDISNKLINREKKNSNIDVQIKPIYGGNRYLLLVYEEYKDVRLVGAPPSSIGKFGADADNWMWPRHTGDFSIFRVYADSLNKPVDYLANNQPLNTPTFFPISLKGIKENDYTMILGYPGTTNRYFTSSRVKEVLEDINPIRVKIRGIRQNILQEDMDADPKIRVQYYDKYYRSSNYWKYFIGESKGIKRLDVINRKKQSEHNFFQWVNEDSLRISKYSALISIIDSLVAERKNLIHSLYYYDEAFLRSIEIVTITRKFIPLYNKLDKNDTSSESRNKISSLKEEVTEFYKDYSPSTDEKVSAAMLAMLSKQLPDSDKFDFLIKAEKKSKSDFEKYCRKLFKSSLFNDSNKVKAFLNDPSKRKLTADPAFQLAYSGSYKYNEILKKYSKIKEQLDVQQRCYIQGLLQKDTGDHYPDANFSMRLTFGQVKSFRPADAVSYNYFTTLSGIMEKEEPDNKDFQVPEKLKKLYQNMDFGIYSQSNDVPVAFISTNDITGGNSGSPVLNSRGELIGLAFDGNWEGLSGDIIFEPSLQRTISVDIRYVLFVIDKFAGAGYLLNEMKIVR